MTIVILGIDALDPDIANPDDHPDLTLSGYSSIETIDSSAGKPSTHELWPTIITGLPPEEHGLTLDDGMSWDNTVLNIGSSVADYLIPDGLQAQVGKWLLNNTEADTFRTPATYYSENGISTVFDGHDSKAIGVPNYVINTDEEDREHVLRKDMGELFERGEHESEDPVEFYEVCMEMSMVRIALTRRALRRREYELVFGYTSGLDLIGHASYDIPRLQNRAYKELNDFVGELRSDLSEDDELVLISDHGLQDGVHTHKAYISSTLQRVVDYVDSVTDIYRVVNEELEKNRHVPEKPDYDKREGGGEKVKDQLEDLGYI